MAETRLVHIIAAVASLWAILKKLNHAGSLLVAKAHRSVLGAAGELRHTIADGRVQNVQRTFRRGYFQILEDG